MKKKKITAVAVLFALVGGLTIFLHYQQKEAVYADNMAQAVSAMQEGNFKKADQYIAEALEAKPADARAEMYEQHLDSIDSLQASLAEGNLRTARQVLEALGDEKNIPELKNYTARQKEKISMLENHNKNYQTTLFEAKDMTNKREFEASNEKLTILLELEETVFNSDFLAQARDLKSRNDAAMQNGGEDVLAEDLTLAKEEVQRLLLSNLPEYFNEQMAGALKENKEENSWIAELPISVPPADTSAEDTSYTPVLCIKAIDRDYVQITFVLSSFDDLPDKVQNVQYFKRTGNISA